MLSQWSTSEELSISHAAFLFAIMTFSMAKKCLQIEVQQILMDSLSKNFDNIAMTKSWTPFLNSFVREDAIASDPFSLLTTASTVKSFLILSTCNNFVFSLRSMSFSCIADLQESVISGISMTSRRRVTMVFS